MKAAMEKDQDQIEVEFVKENKAHMEQLKKQRTQASESLGVLQKKFESMSSFSKKQMVAMNKQHEESEKEMYQKYNQINAVEVTQFH